jgi:hypothetical protein
MRALGLWTMSAVAVLAGVVALLALNAWRMTAWLPYNTEGRYFDAEAGVVTTDVEPQFWAILGCGAVALAVGAGFVAWRLRRPRAPALH